MLRGATTFFKHSRADNSAVRGRIWSKFNLIRDIVVILVTCKNEEGPLKNKDARVATTQNTDFSITQGQITLQSEVGSGQNSNSSEMLLPSYLVTSKYEEDMIKIEGARVATTQNIDFSNTQGQITPQLEVKSGRNPYSSEILWLSLLPARMKKIPLEMKALEHSQHLPHCKSMEIFSNAQGQLTPQSMVELCRISKSSQISWLSLSHKRVKKIRSKM